jgi:hypothetical protein
MVNQRAKILVKETGFVVTQRVEAMIESISVEGDGKLIFKHSKGQKLTKNFSGLSSWLQIIGACVNKFT